MLITFYLFFYIYFLLYLFILGGKGKVTGLDISTFIVDQATKQFQKEIETGKIELYFGSVTAIPTNANRFDCIFHVNCYYFWKEMLVATIELHRVMKPGGRMVTTMNMDSIKKRVKERTLQGNVDPLHYMHALEMAGFLNVKFEYMTSETGLKYEAITATAASEEFMHSVHPKKNEEKIPLKANT